MQNTCIMRVTCVSRAAVEEEVSVVGDWLEETLFLPRLRCVWVVGSLHCFLCSIQ